MKLKEVKHMVNALNFKQLVKLDAWLHSLIETAKRGGGHKPTERTDGHKSYRRELVRCGKKGCKCVEGNLHGPYWYAYWSEKGKTRSQYIGKELPKSLRDILFPESGGSR